MRFRAAVISVLALWFVAGGATTRSQTALGTGFTYQGSLERSGVLVDGESCDLRFTLWNDPSAGSQIGSAYDAIGVNVAGGLFTVDDVDFGTTAFDGDARWIALEVQCPTDGGFVALDPRQPIKAAPYALHALEGIWSANGTSAYYVGGNVGIGTASPANPVDVVGTIGGDELVLDNRVTSGTPPDQVAVKLKTGVGGGSWTAELRQTNASLLQLVNGGAPRMTIDPAGRAGFGTATPATPIALFASGATAPVGITQGQVGGGATMELTTADGIGNQATRLLLEGSASDGDIEFYSGARGAESRNMTIDGASGNVGIGTGTPSTPLDVVGTITSDELVLDNRVASGTPPDWVSVKLRTGIGGGSWIAELRQTNTSDLQMINGGSTRMTVKASGRVGIGTTAPTTTLEVAGTTTTDVLEITGGADLSERFDVESHLGVVEPGMVVSIDPDNPGRLTVSRAEYDRAVAGVVSGAGGVVPGMLMGQRSTVADGEYPVALTGRVFVLVDASRGTVKPGDLLTTSETPGHAKKVTDYSRAQGAILGKAMTGLSEGRGLVLALVTLQ